MTPTFQSKFSRAVLLLAFFLTLTPALLAQIAPLDADKGARARRVFENYDLRQAEARDSTAKTSARAAYRARLSPVAASQAGQRSREMSAARAALASRIPTLHFELNLAGNAPEILGVTGADTFLTPPSGAPREAVVRNFLSRESTVFGLTTKEVADLVKFSEYTNPDGVLSWVEFRQDVLGIPVFQGELRAGLTATGALARTTGNLVPGIDPDTLSAQPKLTPAEAIAKAAQSIRVTVDPLQLKQTETQQSGRVNVLKGGPFNRETRAELVWFSVEPGVTVLAWSMVLWRPFYSYYLLVDAEDGTLLWRKNITQHQTQPATYFVYTSDSPAPLSPTTATPGSGIQGTLVARTAVTLIADDLNASPLGWITDGNNTTLGNNTTAGLDLSAPDGVDGNVTGSGSRIFNFSYTPGTDAPTLPAYRNGVVTNLFFLTNRYHDAVWNVGFNEPARNFQTTNTFGGNNRGGVGGDPVSAEAQDSSGTNNANFSTAPDGQLGVMQMYVFTAPTPDRDGSLDAEIVYHELTHGTSNRLHANASGLATQVSGGMGEGWSDFYARCLLATADENVSGVYASGAYSTLSFSSIGTNNYYYGIRRFPYAVLATVGANGKPHNPLTLADIDAGKLNLSDGAFAASATFAGNPAEEVHNVGEVWCMMLLEFRARLINRLGFATGNNRALQIVTDAMKLDPANPTFISGRDSLIAAASAGVGGAADAEDVRVAFALRGAGLGATSTNPGSGAITVTESFVATGPALAVATPLLGGFPALRANDCNTLTIPLSNNWNVDATAVSAVLATSTSGVTVVQPNSAYPNVAATGAAFTNVTPFVVATAAGIPCGTAANFTLTVTYTGAGSPKVFSFSLPIGDDNYIFTASSGATIPSGGTLVAGSATDDAVVNVTAPFAFSVYSTAVTSGSTLRVSTNGNLQFVASGGSSSVGNGALPSTVFSATAPTVLPFWDDVLLTTTGGGIYTLTTGTAPNRRWYLEWRGRIYTSATSTVQTMNFAVVFSEGSSGFQFLYPQIADTTGPNGSSATVGVQAASTGTRFTQYSFNNAVITSGLVLTAAQPVCLSGTGPCSAPSITSSAPLGPVIVGSPYAHNFAASGSPAPTFVLSAGTLPPGLTLTPAGLLSGTATSAGTGMFSGLTVTASNGNSPTATQNFTLSAATRADAYVASFGLTGPAAVLTADPNFDGVTNLMAYALGLNPSQNQSTYDHGTIRNYQGTNYYSIRFNRSSLATDLTYIVEATSDLAAGSPVWTELARSTAGGPMVAGAGVVISDAGGPPTYLTEVRDTVPVPPSPADPRRFIRLRVTSP